eukprot:1159559-Pelagomonas_calceolata.AAC.6
MQLLHSTKTEIKSAGHGAGNCDRASDTDTCGHKEVALWSGCNVEAGAHEASNVHAVHAQTVNSWHLGRHRRAGNALKTVKNNASSLFTNTPSWLSAP